MSDHPSCPDIGMERERSRQESQHSSLENESPHFLPYPSTKKPARTAPASGKKLLRPLSKVHLFSSASPSRLSEEVSSSFFARLSNFVFVELMKKIVNGTIATVRAAETKNSLPSLIPVVGMPRSLHPQNERDAAVASAMGGASPLPSSKFFLQSLMPCEAAKPSSSIHLVMAGTETKEIEAMVPACVSGARGFGVSGSGRGKYAELT
jgi:hypothetical protein